MIDEKRLKFEIEKMEENYPQFIYKVIRWKSIKIHTWVGKITIEKKTYTVCIRLSIAYPNSRPLVSILNENFEFEDLQTTHKDEYKNLCLYTSDGSDNSWKREYSLVDVVKRVKEFMIIHLNGKDKDIHKTIINEYNDCTNEIKYVVNSDWFPTQSGNQGFITFERCIKNNNFYYAVKVEDIHKNEICKIENNYFRSGNKENNKEIVKWIYLKRISLKDIFRIKKRIEFIRFIQRKKSAEKFIDEKTNKYIIYTGRDEKSILVDIENGIKFSNIIKIDKSMFFDRNKGILDVDKLEQKNISIIGLGSLGSKIAEMFCRAGVGGFSLFDYDQFSPENLSRHILTTEDLFLNKANAIKSRLENINPYVKANSYNFNIFNLDELYAIELDILKNSNLIICATGEEESEYELNIMLNEIGLEKKIPCIFTAILGNGFGGRFHKVLMGDTPCYKCIKLQQEKKPETYKLYNEEVFMQTNEYENGIYSQPGIPGLDVDINFVASITVKMGLEILMEKKQPYFKFNSYIWSNKPGWIFENAFELKDIRFNKISNCPVCGGEN